MIRCIYLAFHIYLKYLHARFKILNFKSNKTLPESIVPLVLLSEVTEGASLTKASWGWFNLRFLSFKAGSELLRETAEDDWEFSMLESPLFFRRETGAFALLFVVPLETNFLILLEKLFSLVVPFPLTAFPFCIDWLLSFDDFFLNEKKELFVFEDLAEAEDVLALSVEFMCTFLIDFRGVTGSVQVNLCQKHSFLNQLTHNTDISLL